MLQNIMNKKDFHLHTQFSADSQIKLAELLPYALQRGYTELAITEHLDLLPEELTVFGIPSMLKYRTVIEQFRLKYPELKLYFGIEVGDFQDVKPFADTILNKMKFDLVLGSVHFTPDHINVAVPLKKKLSEQQIRAYYEKNLALAEECDIDVLAHLGVYKRYYEAIPDESVHLPLIQKIFEVLIRRGIALELNFSCIRKTYKYLLPEKPYLELYKKLGGRLVSIGSDSYTLEHFDDNYSYAEKAISNFGFELIQLQYK